jgi:hypothetical protein
LVHPANLNSSKLSLEPFMQLKITTPSFRLPAWLQRMGLAGFSFFLVKGLIWLSLPYFANLIVS